MSETDRFQMEEKNTHMKSYMKVGLESSKTSKETNVARL